MSRLSRLQRESHAMGAILDLLEDGFDWSATEAGAKFWIEMKEELLKEIDNREIIINNIKELER